MIRSLNLHNCLAKKQSWQAYTIYDPQWYADSWMAKWFWNYSNSYHEVYQDNLDDIYLYESISTKSSRSIKRSKELNDVRSTNMTKGTHGPCLIMRH